METTQQTITLTNRAISEIKELISQKELTAEYGIRISVEGGGCSGFSYNLGFDKTFTEDIELIFDDLKVIVKKSHALYLEGTELDYQDGLNARGFVFNNPNATSTCGCGTSFAV
jgi:iron-sulfur cluster assembly protein